MQRSPADVLRLVVAAAVLLAVVVAEILFGDTLVAFAADLLSGLDALPAWMVDVVVVGTRVLVVVLLGGGLAYTVARHRWRMLATVAAAGAVGLVVWLLLPSTDAAAHLVDVRGLGPLTSDAFPSPPALAATIGVLTAAAPWLSRRWRRLGWTLAMGLSICAFIDAEVSLDVPNAIVAGWLAGAAVLVVLGGPTRRPSPDAVRAGLASVGLDVEHLERASVDARGSTPYFGVGADGRKLFVKVLGDDERSADLLFRFYRRIQPREFGDEKPFSSLRRAVEHEALVALAAADLGVRTPHVRALATAEPNGFVLAYDAIAGRSLDRLDRDELTDNVLGAMWSLVARLQRHRIAHRDLRLANMFLDDDGEAWLIDFGFSELAASDMLLATDVAELLASTSLAAGPERAVALARSAVDRDTLAFALRRLHLPMLSGATRSAFKARSGALAELRRQLGAAVAAPGAGATRP